MDAVRVCLLIVTELVFMGKEDRNCIPRHIVSLVEDLDEWNDYPWGVLIPNVGLYSPLAYMREPWFIASIPFINGLVDEDRNVFLNDYVGVSKDNVVDGKHQLGYDTEGSANVSIAELFAEVRALRHEVALIKVDDERIANVERLLKEKLQNDCATQKTKPDMIPNHFEDIRNCYVLDVTSNHTVVDQGLGGSSNDPMSTCSRADIDNVKVACDGMSVDKADRKNEYTYSQVYDFADGYINVLNDEKMVPNYSSDDMKLQHEEDNLTVEQRPVEHQPVDELIDVQKDKPTLLQENVKHQSNKPQYINVVKDDYKPPLASVFACAKSKTKKYGIRKNYVLKSVKERKKKLAMDLDSPFGQQGTTTPAPPKIRSMSSIEDIVVPLVFEKEPPEYQFPWGFRDIVIGRIYWLMLACLEKAKEGWLQDYVSGNRRPWWRTMKRRLPQQLTLYLNEHGVLQSNDISVENYEITYLFLKVVKQADLFGDCGVWVCIYLYRLSRKQPLIFSDPLQTSLSYRECILQYFWNRKVEA
ncbi:phospholipase-like protein [Tanacetum coccineum]